MALQPYHVTAAGGLELYFGNDIVDGWPIGPVQLVQNQTFFVDPEADDHQHLWLLANAGSYAAGVGSIPPTPGTQNAYWRGGSGIPDQESE